jgi:hypothetical protein
MGAYISNISSIFESSCGVTPNQEDGTMFFESVHELIKTSGFSVFNRNSFIEG